MADSTPQPGADTASAPVAASSPERWWEGDPLAEPAKSGNWWEGDRLAEPADARATISGAGIHLEMSAFGRVLKSFGDGATETWGGSPIGLSEESAQAFRNWGIFRTAEKSVFDGFKAFNEALIRPTAAGLDAALRGGTALVGGGARGINQIKNEITGQEDRSLERDLNQLFGEFLPGFIGVGAPSIRRPRGSSAAFERAAVADAPIPEAAPVTLADQVRGVADKMKSIADEAREIEGRAAATDGLTPSPALAVDDFGVKPVPHELPPAPERAGALFDKRDGTAVDRAGNINLDRIATGDDVKQVIREAAEANGGFIEARRNVMTLAETEALARAAGVTTDTLLQRKVGTAFNAEEAVAARSLLVQSAENVFELSRKARIGSAEDLIAFQEALTRHSAIQEQVAGITAEAGRALSAFRIPVAGAREAEQIAEIMGRFGGRDSIERLADLVGKLETPEQVSRFVMDSRKATTKDMLLEGWINALLSNPTTHTANIASNTVTSFLSLPETAVAAAIGRAREALTGVQGERVFAGEVQARLYGMAQGSSDGLRAALRAYVDEMPTGVGKLDTGRPRAIPSATVRIMGQDVEIGGKQVRIPGRLLQAEDELFKAIAYRQELNVQAYRLASVEKLEGDAFAARVQQLTETPTPEMAQAARAYADYQTFNSQLGYMGQAINRLANEYAAARIVVPFVRTPINILKYAGERTPLGLMSQTVRDNLAGKNGAVARDTQIARLTVGAAIMTTAALLASDGTITGFGPKDPEERALWLLSGKQPYSVRIGDMYYSYTRFDPFATIIGATADAVAVSKAMTADEEAKVGELLFASITNNLVNKSFLSGLSDVLSAIHEPGRYGDKFLGRLAASTVPAGIGQVARTEDPYIRDVRSMTDSVAARLPGFSAGLQVKRDIWGNPIMREGALGPDLLSPVYQTRVKQDRVTDELIRLKVFPGPVDRKIGGQELTPKQYDDYARIAGRLAREQLEPLVAIPAWEQVPTFARQELVHSVFDRSRAAARSWLMLQYPDLAVAIGTKRLRAYEGSTSASSSIPN
jgi:hypothetical protein